ncbi:MAG: class I SAM-dependent methyltransferase [Clostridia bacterium]|nr:class I SAM-dependent methyltransferase [Clostridia bacterium]
MNAPKLDKRLRAVVDSIHGIVLADIGCDHGKVAVCALLEGKVRKAIACDISSKSLDKAVELAKTYGLDNIDFRCGDGLKPILDNEVDCAVIAGMGGKEIMAILSDIPKGIERLILVAHKNTIELREFLASKGLYIDKDFVVQESGKFYNIISAIEGFEKDCRLSEKELYLGKNRDRDPDYSLYIEKLRQKKNKLEEFADKSREAKILKKIFEIIDERQ